MAYFFGLLIGAFLVSIIFTLFTLLCGYCFHRVINFLFLTFFAHPYLEFSLFIFQISLIMILSGVILLIQGSPKGLIFIVSGLMNILSIWMSQRNIR